MGQEGWAVGARRAEGGVRVAFDAFQLYGDRLGFAVHLRSWRMSVVVRYGRRAEEVRLESRDTDGRLFALVVAAPVIVFGERACRLGGGANDGHELAELGFRNVRDDGVVGHGSLPAVTGYQPRPSA
ncbi:hypothetical protein SPHINGOT1_510011 [Sphingomonas sp. T1]|nr:hypothetical protein SPHINGOT1_510011 [Sphingomonas sp. T1]